MKEYSHGKMMGKSKMTYKSKMMSPIGAAKLKMHSGTTLAGDNSGSNVMLRKNTASSTPTQKGTRDFGASMVRVPNRLNGGRGNMRGR